MKYQQISEEHSTAHFECQGSIQNSNDLIFLEPFIKKETSIVLDLSEIDYINSCGFGAMVEETMNFHDAKLKLSIKGLKPNIRKTVAILGGEELLHFLD